MTSACHYEQNLPAAPGSGCKEYLQATVPNFPPTSSRLGGRWDALPGCNIFPPHKYFYLPMLQCWSLCSSPLCILISQYLNNCNECNPGESVAVPSQPGLSASIQCLMVMSNVSIHILLSQIRYLPLPQI